MEDETFLGWVLTHIPTLLFALAIIVGIIVTLFGRRRLTRGQALEAFLIPLFLLPIALNGVWIFVANLLLVDEIAPVQWIVALAGLGLAVTGLWSTWSSRGFRLATNTFASCLMWGVAVGSIIASDEGTHVYIGFAIPLVIWILLIIRGNRPAKDRVSLDPPHLP